MTVDYNEVLLEEAKIFVEIGIIVHRWTLSVGHIITIANQKVVVIGIATRAEWMEKARAMKLTGDWMEPPKVFHFLRVSTD